MRGIMEADYPEPTKHRKTKKGWLWPVVSMVVVLALIAGGLTLFLKNTFSDTSKLKDAATTYLHEVQAGQGEESYALLDATSKKSITKEDYLAFVMGIK